MWAAWPWARGEVRRSWTSLVLIAVLAAVAGGGVMAAVAGARRADTVVDRHFERANWPEVTGFATEPIPEVVEWLESDPRVAGIREIRFLAAVPTHREPGLEGGIGVAASEESLDGLWVKAGRLPTGPDEVAVSELTADDEDLHIGDRLPFHYVDGPTLLACATGEGECGENLPIGDREVVGIVRIPNELVPSPYDQGFFLAGHGFADDLGPLDVAAPSRIVGVVLHDPNDAAAVTAELSLRLPNGDTTNEVAVLGPARRAAGVHASGLRVAAAVAAVAALVVLLQAVSRHIGGRRDEMGTLAALGTTRGVRAVAASAPVMLAGVIAGLAAAGVAIAMSFALPFGLARRADPDPGLHADWWVLGLGAGLVMVAVALAALMAGWRNAAAMNDTSSPGRATVAARLVSRYPLGPVRATGVRFALENGHDATRVPTGQVAAAVAVSLAIIVGGLVVAASLRGLFDTPARYGVSWDLQVPFPRSPEFEAIVHDVAADDGVDAASVAAVGELTMEADGRQPIQEPALGMASLAGSISPTVLEGRGLLGQDEVVVGSTTLASLGLQIGDRIDLVGAERGGGEAARRSVRIVGRIVVPIVGLGDTDRGIVVPLETFDALGGDELVAELDAEAALFLRVPDAGDRQAIRTRLEREGAFIEPPLRQGAVEVLEELETVPVLLIGFTAVLGALAAAHALWVAVRRRGRELAVLRALGFGPRQSAGVIHWQSVTLVVVAVVVGVPLGIIGGRAVWRAIAGSANVLPVVDLPAVWIALAALTATVVALGLAVPPGRRAARLRPAEALRSE
jgi:hypothetical protein